MSAASVHDYPNVTWRTGRKVGRTVYAQLNPQPSDEDILIGVFDTRELATSAVEAHNAAITQSSL